MDYSRATLSRQLALVREGPRAWDYARLACAILLLQAAYWLSHAWISKRASIPVDNQIRVWNVAQIPEPTLTAAQAATLEPREAPIGLWPNEAPAYYGFVSELDLVRVPDADLGIGLAFGGDNVHLFVNGFTVHDPGRLTYPATYHAAQRKIVRVSRGLLHEGPNTVTALLALNEAREMTAYLAIVGDYHALMEATAKRRFFFVEYKFITLLISGVIALVLIVLIPQTQNPAVLVWLSVFCAAIAIRAAIPFYYGSYGGEAVRFIVILSLACLVPFALFMFVHHWTRSRFTWIRWAAMAAFGTALAFILVTIARDAASGFEYSAIATNVLMTLCSAGTLGLLGWHIVTSREIRVWELSALLLVSLLCLIDSLSLLIQDRDTGHLRLVAPFILVGLVAAMLSRNLRLFESMGTFNEALNTELQKREQIIESSYRDLAEAEKRRNLSEERSRILRDVHDGIGGQLIGLLVQARAGRLKGEDTERGLERAMNDLRLVVESLDPEIEGFADALDTMRARFARQLDAAGIRLDWKVEDASTLNFSPSETLQVSRIFQECIANAIRHSGADFFTVRGARRTEDGSYVFRLFDNGRGCTEDVTGKGGRGLGNMKARALVLNGDLDCGTHPDGGFGIELWIGKAF